MYARTCITNRRRKFVHARIVGHERPKSGFHAVHCAGDVVGRAGTCLHSGSSNSQGHSTRDPHHPPFSHDEQAHTLAHCVCTGRRVRHQERPKARQTHGFGRRERRPLDSNMAIYQHFNKSSKHAHACTPTPALNPRIKRKMSHLLSGMLGAGAVVDMHRSGAPPAAASAGQQVDTASTPTAPSHNASPSGGRVPSSGEAPSGGSAKPRRRRGRGRTGGAKVLFGKKALAVAKEQGLVGSRGPSDDGDHAGGLPKISAAATEFVPSWKRAGARSDINAAATEFVPSWKRSPTAVGAPVTGAAGAGAAGAGAAAGAGQGAGAGGKDLTIRPMTAAEKAAADAERHNREALEQAAWLDFLVEEGLPLDTPYVPASSDESDQDAFADELDAEEDGGGWMGAPVPPAAMTPHMAGVGVAGVGGGYGYMPPSVAAGYPAPTAAVAAPAASQFGGVGAGLLGSMAGMQVVDMRRPAGGASPRRPLQFSAAAAEYKPRGGT